MNDFDKKDPFGFLIDTALLVGSLVLTVAWVGGWMN